MHADLDDLLPLFLEEAAARLDRLRSLLPMSDTEPDAAVQARRELHALKGAARLMGLTEVAELCHHAEDGMVGESADGLDSTQTALIRVAELLDDLQHEAQAPDAADPATAPSPDAEQPSIRGGSGELRVPTEIVDGLAERSARMRIAAKAAATAVQRLYELASLAEGGLVEGTADVLARVASSTRRAALELENNTRMLQRLSEQQLDAALRLQVQPLQPFLRTLARHTTSLAKTLGKEVEVTTSGGEVQLDRRILEAIREAALHLVNNAVDHGVEDPEERSRAAKPVPARIHFAAATVGDRVRLVVWDDGRGIDPNAVVRLAVERGLVNPAAAAKLTSNEIYQLLELPGFSTRDLATDVSGRGVGLDAVAASFRSIGGDLWIRSTPGEGTRVTVELPVARRGERVLVVRVGKLVLALPAAAVRSFSRLTSSMLVSEDGRTLIRQGDATMTAVALAPLFDEPLLTPATLVEAAIGGRTTALVVDAIVGDEEVYVRPLPSVAGAPPSVEGIALLSTGHPVAVLALQRLGPLGIGDRKPSSVVAGGERVLRILLTEDTAATREMMRRLLEDAGFLVTAVDTAEEALRRIETEPFDCVITGVDLPGQSGIDLTRRVRSSDLFADLPVVVVSTRDRPTDRLEGLEAGADAYLTKQGMDPRHLMALIRRITAEPAGPEDRPD